MFGRHRADRQTVTVSYDSGGGIALALKDVDSWVVGRLDRTGDGTAPFESYWAEAGGKRWRIDADGRRNDTTTLRDEMGGRIAAIDLVAGRKRGDSIKIWRDSDSVPALVLLLLLSVRLEMFEQANRVVVGGPVGP
jgi:hypothetical protein